jgi:hypothetical protein
VRDDAPDETQDTVRRRVGLLGGASEGAISDKEKQDSVRVRTASALVRDRSRVETTRLTSLEIDRAVGEAVGDGRLWGAKISVLPANRGFPRGAH